MTDEQARDKEVAEAILAQLGGGRSLALMTGASSFSSGDSTLSFRLPMRSTKGGSVKGVKIRLEGDDTYSLETIGQRSRPTYEVFTIERAEQVHVGELRSTFASLTGLHASI